MPRLPENSDRVKINFKSKIQDNAVVIPTVDGAKGKLNAKERKAYLERIIEDFDNKMKVREDQMRQDLEDARRTFERMVELEVMNLPEVLWEMPYEEFLRRGKCVHEVMMSLEADKEKEEKENEALEAVANAEAKKTFTVKREKAAASSKKRKAEASTKRKKAQRKKNGKVGETPLVTGGVGEWGPTPMVTPAIDTRLPDATPHVTKQIHDAKRKLIPASQHRYATRASVRKHTVDSPGLASVKEQLSAQLLDMIISAPDRATLRNIQVGLDDARRANKH
ncbi:borealin-like [Corticium candelabrum]|uniref:borealin-like n=1 Tax=Corticium candelabrum TaxID=121492 RepID=UPI002E26BB27|nr:borealin-like [Corticium candelabrum]